MKRKEFPNGFFEKPRPHVKPIETPVDNIDIVFVDGRTTSTNTPMNCRYCSNHPSNGGSGVCHCTLGMMEIR